MATTTKKKATTLKPTAAANSTCEVIVLLDRSGSMASIKKDMEGGFDSFIADQKKVPGECRLTLVQFDTQGIDTVYEAKVLADVPALTLDPRGGTPLLDAMGQTLTRSAERIGKLDSARRPGKILFLVITDGEENSSHEFKKDGIKKLVEQRTTEGWAFSYLGANVDSFAEANALGIGAAATANYQPNAAGVKHAFHGASAALASFRTASPGSRYVLTDEMRKKMNAGKTS